MSELHDIDRRMAALERIAKDTVSVLTDIRSEVRGLRTEFTAEMWQMRSELRRIRSDVCWFLGLILVSFAATWMFIAHG